MYKNEVSKVPQLKMIKISAQMRVCELGIQRRRCRGHSGGVVREPILSITMNVNNMITTSIKCNIEPELCLGIANVQLIRNKDQLLSMQVDVSHSVCHNKPMNFFQKQNNFLTQETGFYQFTTWPPQVQRKC